MKIYLTQFDYDERYNCYIAEAHVDGVYFAVLVDPYVQNIVLRPVKGGTSATEVRDVLGAYAYMLMDYVAEQFRWEVT